MKIALLTIFILIFGLSIFGQMQQTQQFEYGKPSELKGLKKLYISPTADEAIRKRYIDAVEKSKTTLKLVDDAKDAEIVLRFRPDIHQCIVVIRGQKPDKPRILLQLKVPDDFKPEEDPANKFFNEFMKQYRAANKSYDKTFDDLPLLRT